VSRCHGFISDESPSSLSLSLAFSLSQPRHATTPINARVLGSKFNSPIGCIDSATCKRALRPMHPVTHPTSPITPVFAARATSCFRVIGNEYLIVPIGGTVPFIVADRMEFSASARETRTPKQFFEGVISRDRFRARFTCPEVIHRGRKSSLRPVLTVVVQFLDRFPSPRPSPFFLS
jgi:hypothetical protein